MGDDRMPPKNTEKLGNGVQQSAEEIKKQKETAEMKTKDKIENKLAQAEAKSEMLAAKEEIKEELSTEKAKVSADFLEKVKEKGGATLDRAKDNRGKVLLGAGSVRGLSKLWKSRKEDEEKEEESETNEDSAEDSDNKKTTKTSEKNITVNVDNRKKESRFSRNRGWLAGGSAAVGAGYLFRDKLYKLPVVGPLLDELFNPDKLNVQEAISKVKSDLNFTDEDHLHKNPHIEINEEKGEFTSYGRTIKVDLTTKKIEGCSIVFPTYEEMFHAANLMNFAATTFRGMCKADSPFRVTPLGGDIEVALQTDAEKEFVSGAGFPIGKVGSGLIGTIGTAYAMSCNPKLGLALGAGIIPGSILAGDALIDKNNTLSTVLPSFADKELKEKFVQSLNQLPDLAQGNQETDPGQTGDKKIDETIRIVKEKITDEIDINDPNNHAGKKREIKITQYAGHKDIYKLRSRDGVNEDPNYNNSTYLKIERDSHGNIKKVIMEDTGIEFIGTDDGSDALEQAMRLGVFVSYCTDQLRGKGDQYDAFSFKNNAIQFDRKVKIETSGFGNWGSSIRDRSKDKLSDREVLSAKAIKNTIPMLLTGENAKKLISWLNTRTDTSDNTYRDQGKDYRKNTYIKLLPAPSTTAPLTTPTGDGTQKPIGKKENIAPKTEQQIVESLKQSLEKTTLTFKGKKIALSGSSVGFIKKANGNYVIQAEELDKLEHTPIEVTKDGRVVTKNLIISGFKANLAGYAGSYTIMQDIKRSVISIT